MTESWVARMKTQREHIQRAHKHTHTSVNPSSSSYALFFFFLFFICNNDRPNQRWEWWIETWIFFFCSNDIKWIYIVCDRMDNNNVVCARCSLLKWVRQKFPRSTCKLLYIFEECRSITNTCCKIIVRSCVHGRHGSVFSFNLLYPYRNASFGPCHHYLCTGYNYLPTTTRSI